MSQVSCYHTEVRVVFDFFPKSLSWPWPFAVNLWPRPYRNRQGVTSPVIFDVNTPRATILDGIDSAYRKGLLLYNTTLADRAQRHGPSIGASMPIEDDE